MTAILPHMTDDMFLTDAGFETWLLFQKGFDLPYFAAFPLLRTEKGRREIKAYFAEFMELARQTGAGYVLDTNTWRASSDWGGLLGYDRADLAAINRDAVTFAADLRDAFGADMNVLINGVVGPRGDGYDPDTIMSIRQAAGYHRAQIEVFAQSGADMVSGITMTNTPEAIGIANAAAAARVPCVISFTLETDGCLPTGETLADAIAEVDRTADMPPIYYMINCAHPDHFATIFDQGAPWVHRIRGVRANASRMSHAELDACETLDDGDPQELGALYGGLRKALPKLNVFGGCCGTDHRHVAHMCHALRAA